MQRRVEHLGPRALWRMRDAPDRMPRMWSRDRLGGLRVLGMWHPARPGGARREADGNQDHDHSRREEPPAGGEPFGVTAEGDQDAESLVAQGRQRAGALAGFFAPTRGPLQNAELATPQFLFVSDSKSGGGSERPVETIAPLASKLGLTPKTHKKSDIDKVAADAMACGGSRADLLAARGHPCHRQRHRGNQTTVPQKWPGDRFDVVWVFDLDQIFELLFLQAGPAVLAGR